MSDEEEKELSVEEEEREHAKQEAEQQQQAPLLTVTELRFLATLPAADVPAAQQQEAKAKLLELVKEMKMGPFYKVLCQELKMAEDSKLSAELDAANAEELKGLDAKITDAKENLGESEVREAMHARAEFLARIGDKAAALTAYEETFGKTVGSGGRIDVEFAIIRLAIFFDDLPLLKTHIEKAKDLVEKGGDWERRNLLHVYEATYLMLVRDFKGAAKLLLESVATFTCYKLYNYEQFIFYTVICAVMTLDRVTFREKVINSPDVLAVLREAPHLNQFVRSLYDCDYKTFFASLVTISDLIKRDRYLRTHLSHILRETRIVAYVQFLESYKSVTLQSMAAAFGVSVDFLDSELSRFIAAGRLNCKIDKVSGIVETNRLDVLNTQYSAVIKEGDLLLNRIQKLSGII